MNQKKPDYFPSRELVPLPGDNNRVAIPEPVIGEYYYGRAPSKSAVARSYIQLLLRQRRVIAISFMAAMAIGLLWIFTRPAVYRSVAEMLVTPLNRDGGSNDNLAQDIGIMTRVRSVATEMKMLKSPDLLDQAFSALPESMREKGFRTKNTELSNYPVTISNPRDTDVIEVEVLARDPEAAALLANQILRTNLERSQETIKNLTELASQHVNGELAKCDANLKAALAKLRDFKNSTGVVDVGTEIATYSQGLANLEAASTQARSEAVRGRISRQMLGRELQKASPTIVASIVTAENPVVQQIDTEIASLQRKRAELLQEYQPTAPEINDINKQIDEAMRQKAEAMQKKLETKTDARNPIIDNLQANYINAIVQEQEASSRESITRAQASIMRGHIAKLPGAEEQIALMSSRIKELQDTHAYLAGQKQALSLRMSGGLPSTMPITAARASMVPVSPNIPVSVLLLTMLAALLSLGIAIARDQLDERIHTTETLESVTGRRVLASLPHVRNGFDGLVTNENCPPALLESFRILRGSLLLSMLDPLPRIIMITSAQAGDGKSTTVANLAATIAMNGKKVLVIDCDMRHPSIHYIYDLDNELGLSSILQGDADIEKIICHTGVEKLDVITAGPTTTRPPELLSSPAMQFYLNLLHDRYDCILLDSTPMVNLSDGTVLAGYAEGVVLVVSSDKTRHRDLSQALSLLEQVGVPILGMVYNRSAETQEIEWHGIGD